MKSQPHRVLQVGKFYYPDKGGIETVTKNIFEGFVGDEFQSDVICFKRGNGSEKKYFGKSFILKCGSFFKLASTPISFSFFYWFFKLRNKYDIVHVHCPNPLAAIAIYLFPVNGKIIVHWHSDVITHKLLYYFFRFFEDLLLKRADLILATTPVYAENSEALKPYLHKCNHSLLSVDESQFIYNENRIAEIKFDYKDKKIVFSLGRFVYYKGYEYLIEAAKLLPDDYVILIGGGGPLVNKYKRLIEEGNLTNKVFLILDIPQKDIANYFMACDIFCLPSSEKAEAFGIVMVEAMVFGKPVVATNIPGSGVSWVNLHGSSGLNVTSKSAPALAAGIQEIMNGDYQRYSIASRSRFNHIFTNDEMLARLSNIYQNLIDPSFVIVEKFHLKAI